MVKDEEEERALHPSGRSYIRPYAPVRRHTHHGFVERAVSRSGGQVLWSSGPTVAPLFLSFEDEDGATHGVVAYVFMANSRQIRNRPSDEHRLQARYRDVNSKSWRLGDHPVAFDPAGVDVTLVLGVEPEEGLIIALDPLLYDPLPMGISVFWKDRDIAPAKRSGWAAWERDNLTGVQRDSRSADLGVETLIAFRPERLLEFIRFERMAQALRLDPPLRLRAAEEAGEIPPAGGMHALERQFGLSAVEVLEIIEERPRLAMAMRGGVAEHLLGRSLRQAPEVTEVELGTSDGPPDFWVTVQDGRRVAVECKNASPRRYADGAAKVEVQKTRASKGDAASRLYPPDAFDVLAACMYGPTGEWRFTFRRAADLERAEEHPDRIRPLQRIGPDWANDLGSALSARSD
ncbi:MAG: hypothetical protein R2878_06785 [Thermoleophilia bacterium]